MAQARPRPRRCAPAARSAMRGRRVGTSRPVRRRRLSRRRRIPGTSRSPRPSATLRANGWRGSSIAPDADPLVRRQVQLVARLDVERRIPRAEIAHDAVDPILLRAVRIAEQLRALGILARLALPGGGEGEEEALVAGEAVDHRRLAVPRDIAAIGIIRGLDAAEIGEILAQR